MPRRLKIRRSEHSEGIKMAMLVIAVAVFIGIVVSL